MIKHIALRFLRLLAILAGALVLLLAASYLGLEIAHNQPVTLPPPTGPYAVGRTAVDWVDKDRMETFGATAGSPRELAGWIWYPAETSGAQPGPYLPPAWAEARESRIFGFFSFLIQSFAAVHSHAVDDAALAPAQSSWPVIVFMPGLGPISPDYTSLIEDLASRGYVVLSLNPTYSAAFTVFQDGRVVEGVGEANFPDNVSTVAESKAIGGKLVAVWAGDMRFGLDQLAVLNQQHGGRFEDHLKLDSVGLAGHSFGGATAAQLCSQDDRCVSAADLDGYPYGSVTDTGLKQPFLYLQSDPVRQPTSIDTQAAQDVHHMAQISSRGLIVTIHGMHHFNFTDNAVFFNPVYHLMGALGPIEGARGLAIARVYLATFFDSTLRGQPAPLLDGPSPEYPEVTFTSP